MKKVLFVAKMNELTKGLMVFLNQYFAINYCSETGKSAKSLLELTPPDMVLMLLVGAADFDISLFNELSENYSQIPVLTIGTEVEKSRFSKYYGGWQFKHVMRPIENQEILEAMCDRLNVSADDPMGSEKKAADDFLNIDAGLAQPEDEKPTVLIVDDNAGTLRNVKSLLDDVYNVNVAPSGMKAMTMIGKKRPDVILLDYEMPVMDGKQTLELIKAEDDYKDIPVIFLTGVDDRQHIAEVLALGPAGYILKPPMQEKIIASIEQALMKTRSKE